MLNDMISDSLGDAIIDAVIESKAIESFTLCENGNTVIVWRANSQEQLEASFVGYLERLIRKTANDPERITECLHLMKVGSEKGHPAEEIMRLTLAGFCLRMHGIFPNP